MSRAWTLQCGDVLHGKDNTNLQEAYKSLWDNHLRGVLSEYLRGSMNMMENLKNLEEKYNKANESVKSEG